MTARSLKDTASAPDSSITQSRLREPLLEATLRLAYTGGFDSISLRSVSGDIGKSTTVIFQNFGGRQGLIDAALDHALSGERIRHKALLADLGDFPQDGEALAQLVAYYIRASDRSMTARFCLEAMLHVDSLTDGQTQLRQWMAVREEFWAAVLPDSSAAHVRLLADYTVMEQAFCTVLRDELAYDQMLRKTALAACRGEVASKPEADLPLLTWARAKAFPKTSDKAEEPAPMEALIATVAQRIAVDGIGDINLRRIATEAGVTPSLIIYHYGDFAAFLSAAIWRAMMHELPGYLDHAHAADAQARADWLTGLETAVDPDATTGAKGFYLRYARILGQVCLLARRRPELVPLVRQLRAIEGMGIHSASMNVWPRRYRLDPAAASAFSIWIKAHALARMAAQDAAKQSVDMPAILGILTGQAL